MGRSPARAPVALTVLVSAMVVAGCLTEPGKERSGSPSALIGVWRTGSPGDVESTVEFRADGTFTVLDADYLRARCETESGDWSATSRVLRLGILTRNGEPTAEVVEVFYEVTGNVLVTRSAGGSESWARTDVMRSCSEYGWADPGA